MLTTVYLSKRNNISEPSHSDFELKGKIITILPIITFIDGLLASSLGTGGGFILSPELIL